MGAAGTHNVCVCTYHQNVKLMLVAMNSSQNCKQIIEMCVCDVDNCESIMGHCDDCPDPSELKRFWKNELLKTIDQDEKLNLLIGSVLIEASFLKKRSILMILLRTLQRSLKI